MYGIQNKVAACKTAPRFPLRTPAIMWMIFWSRWRFTRSEEDRHFVIPSDGQLSIILVATKNPLTTNQMLRNILSYS